MKNVLKRIFSFLLCIIIILNTFVATVYASESDKDSGGHQEPTQEELDELYEKMGLDGPPHEKVNESMKLIWRYILGQYGAIASDDAMQALENNDNVREELKRIWTKENVQIKTDSNGKQSLVFSKIVADTLIKAMKDATKDTDNGGYELVKTVPVSKISRLYFNSNEQYTSFLNLLKDNNGIIGFRMCYGVRADFYKVDTNYYWVKQKDCTSNGVDEKFYFSAIYKNLNQSYLKYSAYTLKSDSSIIKNWNDTDNIWCPGSGFATGIFQFYDYFSALKEKSPAENPFKQAVFIVTTSGVSVPVFNSLEDLIEYSIANNLYYTTSDYTGEGQEVIIDYDELDKILSGYYSGMYDMLQRLIEQNGGNALTPEQVQALADQVAASFDMLKAEINKGFEEQDALIQANSNILKAIKSVMEKGFENIEKLLGDISKKLENLKIDTGGTMGGLIVGGIDILLDLAEFIKDFVADTGKGVATLATGFADIVELMSQKFPFSIPWDIAFFVSSFADTPEAPVFELPIKLSRYGIDEKLVIDFSRFEVISKISRSMLTVIYAMGLLKFTDKIISNKKGGAV